MIQKPLTTKKFMKPISEWTVVDFMQQAYVNAINWSADPNTQNGAVLQPWRSTSLIYGANQLPRGIEVPKDEVARWPKEKKYRWMVHAERSVIHLAAFRGVVTKNATLYCPWFACCDCATAIIDAGIIRVVGHQSMMDKLHPTWMDEIEEANTILDAAGVKRCYIDDDLFCGDPKYSVLFRDERWIP